MSDQYAIGLGLALKCGFDGRVNEVIWDDLGVKDRLLESPHFVCLFDSASVKKGLAFFLQAKEHGAAFDWEIDVDQKPMPMSLSFSATSVDDGLVILGSFAIHDKNKIYTGMSQVISAQANTLRKLSKARISGSEKSDQQSISEQVKLEMITDMLALNNRLVNAERELARKHAELRRMSAILSKDLHLAQRILQFSGEAVMVANSERRVVDVNSAYTAMTGFSKNEAINQELILVEPGYEMNGITQEIWNKLSSQGLWQGECMGRRKNGELFPRWLSISVIPDDRGEVGHYVVSFSDISRLKYVEEQWQKLAFYDCLTNLPNRTLFKDRLQHAITQANRDGETLVLLFIDLDDFKVVNDSLGHDAGDALLCETANRLQACTREADSIYRLGGDEFTIIVHGCHNDLDALQVCDKIIQALSAPFFILDNSVHIGASIGIARYPIDGDNPFTLTKNADAAMYAAKANGRNTSCFFSKSLGEKVSNYLNIRTQIAQGLQRDEFLIHLQPEVDLQTGKILSVEALLRWQHPSRGLLLPEEFIAVAEDSGLIIELGDFVLEEALRIVRRLRDLGWADLRVAVNISGRQIMLPHFADRVINCLKDHQLPGQALIVEITESMVLHDLDNAVQVLRHLKRQGIDAAIDDFGKGYSSLNHLHQLPVEFIKIDQSFVFEADVARESETIIRAIVAMAQSLGLKTIAEGIERSSQQTLLTHLGCDIGQGFLYSKPLPYGRLLDYLVSTGSTADC